LGERAYNLVLSDLKMPALNGPVFHQLLKDSCRGITPPVIFSIARGYTPEYAAFLMRLPPPPPPQPGPRRHSRPARGRGAACPRGAPQRGLRPPPDRPTRRVSASGAIVSFI